MSLDLSSNLVLDAKIGVATGVFEYGGGVVGAPGSYSVTPMYATESAALGAVSAYVSDSFNVSQYIPSDPSGVVDSTVGVQSLSDGVTYAFLSMIRPENRNIGRFLYNVLISSGSSSLVRSVDSIGMPMASNRRRRGIKSGRSIGPPGNPGASKVPGL